MSSKPQKRQVAPAIKSNSNYPTAGSALGQLPAAISLHQKGHFAQAEAIYLQILNESPNHFDATQLLGTIYAQSKKFELAVQLFSKAIATNPNHIATLNNFANALVEIKKFDEAFEYFKKAISLRPKYAEAHNNLGNAYRASQKIDLAIACFETAIALKPDYIEALHNCGNAYKEQKKFDLAIKYYEKTIKLKPDYEYLYGLLLFLRMYICDWAQFSDHHVELIRRIEQGQKASAPFGVLGMINSPSIQHICSKTYIAQKFPLNPVLGPIPKRPKINKIRIGYYSADFHSHATAYLMAEFFELHNKDQFELIAFSFGIDQQDEMHQRLKKSFDQFIEVQYKTDKEIAVLSRELAIDIAVDLKGFTFDGRTDIFAYRAAPIQVSYLGYPGTMGAGYIDYLIADKTLIPAESQKFYSEKIVYLPNSYQVNDRKRVISSKQFTREELGLPEKGFVFCCFNNNYKITPDCFYRWMRILHAVEGSVLWLLQDNEWVIGNLQKEALKHGINPDRLIFAERIPVPHHLARHRYADLFLDTLPCNAHTTTSDALWAGLPVLTLLGESFAGRVAASLLNAMNLPELIASTPEQYEALAIELAKNPQKIAQIKQKLLDRRLTSPLFDTPVFTRQIEMAYTQMMERYWSDLMPDHLEIVGNNFLPTTTFPLDALLARGITLYKEGRYEQSRLIYERILEHDPSHYDSIQILGAIAAQTRNYQQAEVFLAKALTMNPSHLSVLNNYGLVLKELKQYEQALSIFDKAISLKPDHADTYYNRANVLLDMKCYEDAVSYYNEAVRFQSDYVAAHANRGNALQELGRTQEALASYDLALSLNPDSPDVFTNRGNALMALKQIEPAIVSFGNALTLKPDYAEAYLNRGLAFHEQKQYEAAIADDDQAIRYKPDFPQAHYNRGNALMALGRFDEAIESYQKALSLKADYAEAYNNWGNALKEKNQLSEANFCYDRAITIKPDFAEAKTNKSLSLLLAGDYKTGWELFEWRWKSDIFSKVAGKRVFKQPLWLGDETISNQTILLYPEQGYGDIIQFSRYVKYVAAFGAKVILEIPKPLIMLLSNLQGVSAIIEKGQPLPDFDFQCPLHTLPLSLKTTLDNIPSPGKYLYSDALKVMAWKKKLGPKIKPRIGLVWSSSSAFKADSKRSITLSQLLMALPEDGAEYICLQKVIKDEDLETLKANPKIQFFGDQLHDFNDTAALIDCLDLVVSTCTSVPHLSAALGKKTWLMISHNPDWRWLLDRTDSPWYQSMTLYRQPVARDWDSVFKKVKQDLLEFIRAIECS
ncbi:tetratricopeptide repeat protein [Polynucleobacter paneuropaeus]|nr:tetratricopeptide repeat protein [Polynucleobacter paneuropaeus]